MIDNTKLYTSYPLFIAIDGEGSGTDAVAAAGLGTKTDSPETIGASGDANNAYTAGTTVGSYLAELGFNLDFAPAADLKVVDGNAAGSSSYGTDAATVASFVTGMQTGLQEQKVTAAIGHFPASAVRPRARRMAWLLRTEVRKISEPMNLRYSRAVLILVRPK